MIYDAWAKRWNIPDAAMQDLKQMLGIQRFDMAPAGEGHSESYVQSIVRLEAAQAGVFLWRNNVGAGMMASGSFVRFGLANESERMNTTIKSSDLIGWYPMKIKQHHVGHTFALFIGIEDKREDWKFTGTEREIAQLTWLEQINIGGGVAGFINGPGQLKTLLTNAVNRY